MDGGDADDRVEARLVHVPSNASHCAMVDPKSVTQ